MARECSTGSTDAPEKPASPEVAGVSPGIAPLSDPALGEVQRAETQLLRELRDRAELFLQEQEHMVRCFTEQLLQAQLGIDGASLQQSMPKSTKSARSATSTPSRWSRRGQTPHVPCQQSGSSSEAKRRVGSGSNRQSGLAQFITGGLSLDSDRRLGSFLPKPFQRLLWVLSNIKEPERTGRLANIVLSHTFDLMTLMLIVLNAALVTYQTNQSARLAVEPYLAELHGQATGIQWDTIVEVLFAVYFMVELLLRLTVHRLYFFCNAQWCWNVFDFVTVTATLAEVVMNLVGTAADTLDVVFLRTLRVFRLTRSLRMLRALHYVRNLQRLMECIVSSLPEIFWCIVFVVFITAIFATFLVQCATSFWEGGQPPESSIDESQQGDLDALKEHFGSVQDAMFSLFQATSGGNDWGYYYDILSYTGVLAPAILVVHILFFLIAAWNIVTSRFLERALTLAQPDSDSQLLQKHRQDIADIEDLMNLIGTIDKDDSGTITLAEFKTFLSQPHSRAFFELRNIDIKDAEMFFLMLQAAAGTEDIRIDIVVSGLMRMRGVATNLDLQTLQFRVQMQSAAHEKTAQGIREELCVIVSELHSLSKGMASLAREAHCHERERSAYTLGGDTLERYMQARSAGQSEAMKLVQEDIQAFKI